MSISSIGASSIMGATTTTSTRQPTAAEIAAADSSFQNLIGAGDSSADDAKQMLAEITQGGAAGYWAWQVKQMREKAAAQVMGSMGVTPDQIAGMNAKDRVAMEDKIEQLVEQKVKQEIAASSQKQQQQALPGTGTQGAVASTQSIQDKQQQTLAANASTQSIILNGQSVQDPTYKNGTATTNDPSSPLDLLLFGAS